jgi:anthrone oxygenase-like protein
MLSLLATVCAGLFSGAAIYVNLVEHPARLSCGTELAVKEFGPSYRRGTVMQASLALVGCALGVAAWARGGDPAVLIAAVLLGAVVPFTLIVLLPTNQQLLDPGLDTRSALATELLTRWGWLHGVRSGLSLAAFVLLLTRLEGRW